MSSIYATPSIILRASGSVGVTFIMWLLGATVAATGTAVYVELGSVRNAAELLRDFAITFLQGLPRSGGEKNYLEFIYRRPEFLITCTYAVYTFIMVSRARALDEVTTLTKDFRAWRQQTVSFLVNVSIEHSTPQQFVENTVI